MLFLQFGQSFFYTIDAGFADYFSDVEDSHWHNTKSLTELTSLAKSKTRRGRGRISFAFGTSVSIFMETKAPKGPLFRLPRMRSRFHAQGEVTYERQSGH
jgi:hypothetical protein